MNNRSRSIDEGLRLAPCGAIMYSEILSFGLCLEAQIIFGTVTIGDHMVFGRIIPIENETISCVVAGDLAGRICHRTGCVEDSVILATDSTVKANYLHLCNRWQS